MWEPNEDANKMKEPASVSLCNDLHDITQTSLLLTFKKQSNIDDMEMEDERMNKHGKRKILPLKSLTIGGEGGITGLLVFGGALAVAGFMAVTSFATKKHKAKRIHHIHHPQQFSSLDDDDSCCSCWTSRKSINQVSSSELLSEQPMLLEEKIDHNKPDSVEENPTCFQHQEVAFSDYSHPESAELSKEKGFVEEKDEPQDGLPSTETEEEDEDKDVDMKSDDVTETDEDRSKAIGTTFLEYEEPVWTTAPKEATSNEKASFSVVSNEQPSILTTWVMPMLFFALLSFLVLLTHGLRETLYVLDDGDSETVQ